MPVELTESNLVALDVRHSAGYDQPTTTITRAEFESLMMMAKEMLELAKTRGPCSICDGECDGCGEKDDEISKLETKLTAAKTEIDALKTAAAVYFEEKLNLQNALRKRDLLGGPEVTS